VIFEKKSLVTAGRLHSINAQSTIALPKKLEQKNKSIATLLQRGLSFSRNFSARFFD
jgi:hypothetical protein